MQDSHAAGTKPASRRSFFVGAASVGAAAAAVTVLPKIVEAPASAATPAPGPAPEKGGGYSLSEHVKRYYRSTSA
ncbi:formate dehydrogenase region TAT target [Variovorax sp. PBL-H6]|uniref:formate dehydrogenase n=1 Tax=Variovorax sp. PBL-H6 TaxID=434009 RepID=UPI0013173C86|nr:formate dehydrogenase [Variovorax sp. PBL-H6]VTU20710.1 formate dehydrogenase region TAT target [Variovorax sp. PBL-H6]